MVSPFEFSTAQQIVFGAGTIQKLPALAKDFGQKLFVVTGSNPQRIQAILTTLEEHGSTIVSYALNHEPSLQDLEEAVTLARARQCECIIGIGGGAVIDLAKAVAIMCSNAGAPLDYLEVIGKALPFSKPALPYIAVPTTSGTGAEVTKNSVLYSPEHQVKISMRHNSMLPRIALVDPELTYSLPPQLTASTGMDALTQLIEPFFSPMATPMTDALCRYAIPKALHALPKAYAQPNDAQARADMALASLYGGMALANAKLGSVHGIAGPLGGMCPKAAHGHICARLLPNCLAMNYAKRQRGDSVRLEKRFRELAQMLTLGASEDPAEALSVLEELQAQLKIPGLAPCGLTQELFPDLIKKSKASSSMKGNPLELTEDELNQILSAAL